MTFDELLAYLREHGERYTPEALRDHLLAHGCDAALIDRAFAAYEAERAAPASRPRGRPLGVYLLGLPLGLVNTGLLVLGFFKMFSQSGSELIVYVLGLLGVELGLGLLLSLLSGSSERGRLWIFGLLLGLVNAGLLVFSVRDASQAIAHTWLHRTLLLFIAEAALGSLVGAAFRAGFRGRSVDWRGLRWVAGGLLFSVTLIPVLLLLCIGVCFVVVARQK